jgi:hypothetical protein
MTKDASRAFLRKPVATSPHYDTTMSSSTGRRRPLDVNDKVSSSRFYGEYHGHPVPDLEILLPQLRSSSDSILWTAGDSSLDNKYWFNDRREAVGAYKDVLEPPTSVCDVTYWLNYIAAEQQGGERIATINTAVEATTLNERTRRLRPQDIFLRENIREEDTLVVSIGGNDVALAPTPCTILSMLGLLSLPVSCIENATPSCGAVPCDDCCCGCGASLLSCGCTFPPCAGYFRHLFGVRVEKYIQQLTAKTMPKRILVCMIYYPDENHLQPSWANKALGALGYNTNPAKLQAMIRTTFANATSNISIAGNTTVIPVPLFDVLDGKRSDDFVARVEPSAVGGRKMAEFILDHVQRPIGVSAAAPSTSYMEDRS